MKIHTKTVWDIETGDVVEDQFHYYEGALVLCDRSMQKSSSGAMNQAEQTAGKYGSTAQDISGNLTPQLQRWTVAPPGYGARGVARMETSAMQGAGAKTGAMQEAARLRAMRTGNAAALPALEAAEAQGGARGAGSTVEDILARNEMLKSQQQMGAMKGLEGMYGSSMRGDIGAQGLVPEDIRANLAAGQQGWLQNTMGIMGALGGMGTGAGAAMAGYGKMMGNK